MRFHFTYGLTAALLGSLGVGQLAAGQQIQFGDRVSDSRQSHVLLLSDSVEVTAGTPQDINSPANS